MEQSGLLEQNENDDVLRFDFSGADQAGNLADMAVWSHYLKIYVWLEGRALYRLLLINIRNIFLTFFYHLRFKG